MILWLQNPGRRRDAREIMLDLLALIVFTPMAFFGTYMALLAAETWCVTVKKKRLPVFPESRYLFQVQHGRCHFGESDFDENRDPWLRRGHRGHRHRIFILVAPEGSTPRASLAPLEEKKQRRQSHSRASRNQKNSRRRRRRSRGRLP